MSGEVHALVNLTPSDNTSTQQIEGCVWPQSQTDNFGERKYILPLLGYKPRLHVGHLHVCNKDCYPTASVNTNLFSKLRSHYFTYGCNTSSIKLFFLMWKLTKSMQQRYSWKQNSSPASKEMSSNLWHPKVHYHFHDSPPTVPTLGQINPIHTLPSYFLKIHFNIIFPAMPMSSK